MLRRTVIAVLALTMVLVLVLPATATTTSKHHKPDVVDVVLKVSGTSGFDSRGGDYDLLREALIATDLVQPLKDADDITVWAPNDRAFKRLARDLGWEGRGEKSAFAFFANLDPALLADVLLYHVTPDRLNVFEVLKLAYSGESVDTLLGETFRINNRLRLIDNEPDLRNPRLTLPLNVRASNGIIHTINRVLIPIDL